MRLQGIELNTEPDVSPSVVFKRSGPSLADILEEHITEETEIDPTTIALDRNYEYTIWLSYAEVYNEKAYDLFASVDDDSQSTPSGISRPTSKIGRAHV